MTQGIQQAYRHIVQQHIVRQETGKGAGVAEARGAIWASGGVLAMVAAAAVCGALAQAHLG